MKLLRPKPKCHVLPLESSFNGLICKFSAYLLMQFNRLSNPPTPNMTLRYIFPPRVNSRRNTFPLTSRMCGTHIKHPTCSLWQPLNSPHCPMLGGPWLAERRRESSLNAEQGGRSQHRRPLNLPRHLLKPPAAPPGQEPQTWLCTQTSLFRTASRSSSSGENSKPHQCPLAVFCFSVWFQTKWLDVLLKVMLWFLQV